MSAWKALLERVRYLGRRSRFDRELDDEIGFHLDMRAEELQQDGLSASDARAQARREFGSRVRMREDTRAAWQWRWLDETWRDVRYAARAFARSPGFTAVAMLSLGIGVGANCVMFSLVDATLLRPPRVPRPNTLVAVVSTGKAASAVTNSYPDYLDVRERNRSLAGLSAFTAVSAGLAPRPGAEPRVKDGQLVTDNFFDVMGATPERGRLFLPDASRGLGEDRVAILSHAYWQDDLGADPAVLGKPVRINGIDFTVVGVLPARFTGVDEDLSDDEPDFYLPMRAASEVGASADLLTNRSLRSLTVFGRLKPGVRIDQARADLTTLAVQLANEHPDTNKDRSLTVQTLLQFRSGGSGGITMSAIAMLLAGLVLLIACANVAGLLTSRAPARAQEIAVRLAMGAGRPRLVRQLLTESLLLAVGGGLVGLVVGYIPLAAAARLAVPFDSTPLPFELDTRVALFSMALALLSVVLFALLPAFQATRTDLSSVIKGAAASPPRRRWLGKRWSGRHVLVAGQVAIALLLLTITTVLYAGAYDGLLTSIRNPGFQVDHLLAMDFDPATVHYRDARAGQFFKDLIARLRATTGVRAASLSYQDVAVIRPDGPAVQEDTPTSGVWADDGFFDTLGIPVVAGRAFRPADLGPTPAVAIVNEVLARHDWPGQNAIGKQIHVSTVRGSPSSGSSTSMTTCPSAIRRWTSFSFRSARPRRTRSDCWRARWPIRGRSWRPSGPSSAIWIRIKPCLTPRPGRRSSVHGSRPRGSAWTRSARWACSDSSWRSSVSMVWWPTR